jgi:hypothetical protein
MHPFMKHIEDQYQTIKEMIGEEKYDKLRRGIIAKSNENTSFFHVEYFLNMLIETIKRYPNEFDVDHVLMVYKPE